MISDHTVSSPLFVPDSLKFYVNRLSFSKNRVRLQALSSDKATQGSQVIVRLPSNTMINLASLTMTGAVRAYFDGTANATDGVALPTNWDFSFIETLSLIANGGIITQPFKLVQLKTSSSLYIVRSQGSTLLIIHQHKTRPIFLWINCLCLVQEFCLRLWHVIVLTNLYCIPIITHTP